LMLIQLGQQASVDEVEAIHKEMNDLYEKRNNLIARLLKTMKTNKTLFRPCHQKRIDSLRVHTEFWVI